jgi:hypothetical protein
VDVRIEQARPDDVDDVLRLLTEQHLPLDGLRAYARALLVARQGHRIVGTARGEVEGTM